MLVDKPLRLLPAKKKSIWFSKQRVGMMTILTKKMATMKMGMKKMAMKKMATMPNALPLSKPATYTGLETTERWDQDRIYGCVCDSSWPVGLGPGQRQEPEWFGPWCSLRHCPSGDDPYTTHVDETNCTGVTAAGGYGVGEKGNLCQVDCANRGKCDTETGECNCWTGSYGHDCTLLSALAR